MIIEMKKMATEQRVKLPDLITRPVGRRMYTRIARQLEIAGDGEVVIMDFLGIVVIDSSFIDECIIRLIKDSQEAIKRFFIKLRNISDITEINLDSVLNSYYTYNNEKIAVITDSLTRNQSCFLGNLSNDEKDVIDYLRINKTARVDDLAAIIALPVEEAVCITEELYRIRLIRKDASMDTVRYMAV